MSMIGKVTRFFEQLNEKAAELQKRSAEWKEEAMIKSEADIRIKTDNFASERERRIMQAAAEKEQARKEELSRTLAKDPVLARLHAEALADISTRVDTTTVQGARIADEVALKRAMHERELEEQLKDPRLREVYEALLKRSEAADKQAP